MAKSSLLEAIFPLNHFKIDAMNWNYGENRLQSCITKRLERLDSINAFNNNHKRINEQWSHRHSQCNVVFSCMIMSLCETAITLPSFEKKKKEENDKESEESIVRTSCIEYLETIRKESKKVSLLFKISHDVIQHQMRLSKKEKTLVAEIVYGCLTCPLELENMTNNNSITTTRPFSSSSSSKLLLWIHQNSSTWQTCLFILATRVEDQDKRMEILENLHELIHYVSSTYLIHQHKAPILSGKDILKHFTSSNEKMYVGVCVDLLRVWQWVFPDSGQEHAHAFIDAIREDYKGMEYHR